MSGRGETPEEDDGDVQTQEAGSIAPGEAVYTEDGERLGIVRGFEEGGFFVSTRAGSEKYSIGHARSGHDFGEAHLMWRCMDCGEMGEIDEGMPETCPNCHAEKEELMWWTED